MANKIATKQWQIPPSGASPVRGPLAQGLWMAWSGVERGFSIIDACGLHHGSLVGTGLIRDPVNGLRFIGSTTDYVTTPGHQMTTFSHVAVITPDGGNRRAISTMAESPGSGTHDRNIYIDSSTKFAFRIFDGSVKVATGTSTVTDRTYVVVATADGSNIRLYVDGVQEASTPAGNAFAGFTSPELVFGFGYDDLLNNGVFVGTLHAHYVYSRALSAADAYALSRDPYQMFQPTRASSPRVRVPVTARTRSYGFAF